jgi:hypothetical protein
VAGVGGEDGVLRVLDLGGWKENRKRYRVCLGKLGRDGGGGFVMNGVQ